MGEELREDVAGPQLQAAGADAGVAGEVLRLIDRAVDEKVDPVLRVVHQPQDGGGAGSAAQQLPELVLRGEGEPGGADLGGEVLRFKGLIPGHAEEIELRLLAVAEKEVFADGAAQDLLHRPAFLHVVGGVAADPVIGDVQGAQKRKGRLLLGEELPLRRAVMKEWGEVHASASIFLSFSPTL